MTEREEWETRFFFLRTKDGKIDIFWKRVIAVVILVAILPFGIIFPSMRTVSAGHKGLKLQFGKVVAVLDEGLHFAFWFFGEKIEIMDVQIQKSQHNESAASSDLQEVTTEIAVNYRLNPAQVETIYTTLRFDYEARVIRPNMDESLKASTAQFTASELITKRAEVKYLFLNTLRERLEPYHIEVLAVSLTDFQFSPEFTEAIEAANTAKQNAIKAKNYLEQVTYEAQQRVIQAEAQYNATVLNAEGEKMKSILEAEGKAEAIRLVQEQLAQNPEYLDYVRILQWNGILPYFYSSEIPIPFLYFDLPTNSTASP